MSIDASAKDQLSLENLRDFISQIFREVVREEFGKLLGVQRTPELLQDNGKTILPHLGSFSNPVPAKISQNWLTHSEAAAYLKITSAILYKLSSLRKIKFSKRGKRNYYKIEHLEQYLADGEILTQEEIKDQTRLKGKMKIV